MKIFDKPFAAVFAMVAICTMCPSGSVAQTITNGYVCSPKNPGGEETRRFFRQQDGVAINLSQTATFPVVCPVVITREENPYLVQLTFRNGGSVQQTFSCALEEYDILGSKVSSVGKAVQVAPNQGELMSYDLIYLEGGFNYLSLRCIIPPRGMVALVNWF